MSTSEDDDVKVATKFKLVVTAQDGGAVSSVGGSFEQGSEVSITASADKGYEFTGWTGSEETSNKVTLTINSDLTLTANFQLVEEVVTQFTVTITAETGGIVSASGGSLNEGTILSITATADEGYQFTGWTGSDEASNVISITISSDHIMRRN